MNESRALILDDEPDIRELLSLTLMRMGIDCDTAKDIESAKTLLRKTPYNICLTDMRLPDGDGLEIVKLIQDKYPSLPVAVITAHGNMDTAIDAMKAGAFDFLNKPVELTTLRQVVESAIQTSKAPDSPVNDIVGQSAAVEKLKAAIRKLSRSQAPVYISGESGSGKELVARSIHRLGPRVNKPFVPVNCGAIPSELVESEFFGYTKGAFTGAQRDTEGLFQAANGGTLFLDEVADLPLSMQVKILRAIQEKAVRAVGSQAETSVDVRILCATHKDLSALVAKGEFRQDLFYRLNVIQLDVPPLRERREDIQLLIDHILTRLNVHTSLDKTRISPEALKLICDYSFPGNIRELENILERAFTLCENNCIEEHDLRLADTSVVNEQNANQIIGHFSRALKYPSMDEYLAEIEKEILLDALEHDKWNKTSAAQTLGITFRSFRYRLSKLGLNDEND